MNQRKIGTILSYVYILVSNSISIVYTPYMLRMMGQSEYGLYGTANSFISYLTVLSFGIGGAYIKFNSQYRAENDIEGEKRLNGMFLIIFSFLSLIVFICGMAFIVLAQNLVSTTFTANELYKLRIIMFIMTLNLMVTFIFNVVQMALQAYEQFICIRLTLIIASIIQPILNVIALNQGGRSVTITFISFLVSLICYFFFLFYAWNKIKLRFSFKNFDWHEFKELFVFSAYLFLNSITDQITFSTDNIVISSMIGTNAVAIYTVGANFKGYFQNFSTSISSVFAPKVNLIVSQNKDRSELDDLFIRIGRIQFYVVSLILIGYVSIGRQFITIWAGEGYEDSFEIGLLLIIAVFVPAIQNIGIEIQKALNMHKARSIVYFFIALINVLLTIIFIRFWGSIGAAMATTICMFVGTVIFMNYYYYKKVGLDIPKFWKEIGRILPGYIIPIIVGIGVSHWSVLDNYWNILLAAIAITLAFFVSCWTFSMNQYEKGLILDPLKKILKKIKK